MPRPQILHCIKARFLYNDSIITIRRRVPYV